MGKKQDNAALPAAKSKRGVIKRKQMFNQLSTIQEEKAKKARDNAKQETQKMNDNFIERIQQQGQYKIDVESNIQNKKGSNVEQICQAVNRLFAKNKIGVKNAFQVPIIDLQTLDDYKKMQSQNSWKLLSSTLQNDYRIYGYRVDAIHSITYKILNTLSRAATQDGFSANQQAKIKREQSSNANLLDQDFFGLKQNFSDNIDLDKNQLQKNKENLDIKMMEYVCSSDPVLQRTKRLFDEPGLKGLLMNNININKNLQLPLNSNLITEGISQIIDSLGNREVKPIQHPLQVFQSVQKLKYQISSITKQEHEYMTKTQLESLWKKAKNNKFQQWAEPKQYYMEDENNHFQMIDQNLQNRPIYQNESYRQISDFIKIKKSIKTKFNIKEYEIEQGGAKWLDQIDRKFLGIKSSSNNNINKITQIKAKIQRDEDYIDFNQQEEDKNKILRKQSQKMQFKQEIQDKFLMPVRLTNQFKIQKVLTLREQPQQLINYHAQQQVFIDQEKVFLQKQIDIKRQNLSIKDTKQKIFIQIKNKKKSYFSEAFSKFNKDESEISPALCFLTLLHLANQNNLAFKNIQNEQDFQITKETQRIISKEKQHIQIESTVN